MTKTSLTRVVCLCLLAAAFAGRPLPADAKARRQSGRPAAKVEAAAPAEAQPARLLKRTTTRREVRTFGYGGTFTLYGAPEGSVTIEAWQRPQIEVIAEVELQAETEEDLALLAEVNRVHLDEDFNHFRLFTLGTHDSQYLKRSKLKLPKRLLGLPWRADYRVRVPAVVDLRIQTGRGPVSLSGIDGSVRLNAGAGGAAFELAGGDFEATLGGGPVTVRVPTRSWRGRGLTLRLAGGDLTIELPVGFSGDLDAEVLRTGRVENHHAGLLPRAGSDQTDRVLRARAGSGGAPLSFTVGDGIIRIIQAGAARQPAEPKP